MSNSITSMSLGNNGQCYSLFIGVRVNSTTPPTNLPNQVRALLYVNPNGTYLVSKRSANSNGGAWSQFTSITSPFIFYDLNTELVCLVNFSPGSNPTSNGLLGATAPNVNVYTGQSAAGVLMTPGPNYATVTPVSSTTVTSSGATLTATAPGMVSAPVPAGASLVTVAAPSGTNPQAVANSINASANLFSPAPSGVSLNANLVRTDPSAGHLSIAQLRDSQLYVGPLQVNGPHQTGPRIPAALLIHARASNKSVVSAADVGAYTAGHATNCSVLHADNDASHVHALAHDNSKAMSLGHGSTAAGQAGCGSALVAGGAPTFPTATGNNSRYRLMAIGAGAVQHRRVIYSLDKNNRCPTLSTLLEDATPNRNIPPLNCQVCINNGTGDHAPGAGHGSIAHGVSLTNSLLQTSGDGAAAVGIAKCGEVHAATGLASQSFGRNNLALSPYSMATGQNSVTHMYGQFAQGIKGSHNSNVPENCDVCQFVRVVTHSHVDCMPVLNDTGTAVIGFLLTYRMVLGSTPEDAQINTPDGLTVTNYHLPSLVCPGVAKVDVQVSSSQIVNNMGVIISGTNSDAFAVDYCFFVERVDRNQNQSCHHVIPEAPATVPIIGNCIFSTGSIPYFINGATPPIASAPISPVLESDPTDNICGGFTILFTEFVPTFITIPPSTTPIANPRIQPTPTTQNTTINSAIGRLITTFQIYSRIICATFQWTQTPAGFSRVACIPTAAPVTTVVTTPTFTPVPPQIVCPTNFGGGSGGGGGGGGGGNVVNPGGNNGGNNGGTGVVGGVVGATNQNSNCLGCTQTPTPQFQTSQGGQVFAGSEFSVSDIATNFDTTPINFIQGMNQQFASH